MTTARTTGQPPRVEILARQGAEPIDVEVSRARRAKPADLAIRFAFGFGVSVIAGVVTLALGDHLGGLFLAFPAILPASLTLIGEKEGDDQAELDAVGATVGAVALVAFAFVAVAMFTVVRPTAVEVLAAVAWLAVASGLYVVARAIVGRGLRGRRGAGGPP